METNTGGSGRAPRPGLTVDIHDEAGQLVLELAGELDLATRGVLNDFLVPLANARTDGLILDVRGLRFADAAGVKPLRELLGRCGVRGIPVTVTGARPLVALGL